MHQFLLLLEVWRRPAHHTKLVARPAHHTKLTAWPARGPSLPGRGAAPGSLSWNARGLAQVDDQGRRLHRLEKEEAAAAAAAAAAATAATGGGAGGEETAVSEADVLAGMLDHEHAEDARKRYAVRGPRPPPPSRSDWTRLVPPPVLSGHVSSLLPPPPPLPPRRRAAPPPRLRPAHRTGRRRRGA